MSEHDLMPPQPPEPPRRPARSRLRRFLLRHLPLAAGGAALLLVIVAVGAYFGASSHEFENLVRKRLIASLETATGGRVEIASFHWRLLALEADAGGIVIHGREAPGEAPYARIGELHVKLSVLGFVSPHIRLRDLEISHPELHLIVYPDGTTNQPHPRQPSHLSRSTFNRLFDLRAGHVTVVQGVLDYDNRAAAFDFQNRFAPLNFAANDVSLRMGYVPAASGASGSYRIEAGATNLTLSRSSPPAAARALHGRLEATIDLERNTAVLRSLRLTAHRRDRPEHTLEITGDVVDFGRLRWQAKVSGAVEMNLLDPLTGFPYATQGVAHLDLTGAGQGGQFHVDGGVRIDGGAYIGPGVTATGVNVTAHLHADPQQLLITSAVAHLRQGGQLEGEVALTHWLPSIPGAVLVERAAQPGARPKRRRLNPFAHRAPAVTQHPTPVVIPVSGKVTAKLKNVSLDTILDIVGKPPFQRLGLDGLVNGPTTATWTGGEVHTLVVSAALNLSPSGQPGPGEAPTSGTVDATYTQSTGMVAIRNLSVHTPDSQLQAYGELGADPPTRPTSLSVDLQSRNLSDFNTALRSLGLKREGHTGTAALPVTLAGQATFHGTWTGSLVRPHIAGRLQAAQLGIEMLPPGSGRTEQSRFVRLDAIDVAGSYSPERIAISHGVLRRGATQIVLSASLNASPATLSEPPPSTASEERSSTVQNGAPGHRPQREEPAFNTASILHLRLQADRLSIAEMQPFFPGKLPATGAFDARIQVDGPLRALDGSGRLEMNNGAIYGEPVTRVRAQGTIANQVLKLTSLTANAAGGAISGSGSYDLVSGRFEASVHGAGIGISRIDWLRRRAPSTAGKLAIEFSASGTASNPQLQGSATLTALTLGGQQLGDLKAQAHTSGRTLNYQATASLAGAALNLHGQTTLNGAYPTQAQLDFSRFDIASLLKLARVTAFTGQSSLAGAVTVQGPLAHPDQLQGEARLQELAVTVAGVHLKSQDGLRATLADARVQLAPLHITGENTDLSAQGSVALTGSHQLDLAASGSINMKLAETLDPDLTASGTTTFQVQARGTLGNPGLRGRINLENSSLSLANLANGLSQLHGTLVFNQNRLEVRSLTAMTGGGQLSIGGYLSYQQGIYANLSVTGKGIRISYPQGINSVANATLSLEGTQTSLLLSGNVLITRFMASPDLDIAALAAQANAVSPITPPNAPSNHIRLDVRIRSAPQLNFQNAFAKLAGNVNLHVGGTVATPSLLGQVSITEGSALIAGTQYELQRGQISFTNPVRIEPTIDLSATARAQDYDVTLGLHGTAQNMAVTYRSDPPLPEADVISLLALGRTVSQERLYTQQQEQALTSPNTDNLLAGALNATVSSRVQKLFGAGSVKVDPNYLGAFGISTSRITVQEQLGRNVTLTYATDVNTTGQQLLQADVAINRHISVVVARDESGVFSMVIKTTRRFR